MIARVILDIAHSNIDRTFDYLIPEGMEVAAGQRVLVPFGGKVLKEGYVMSVEETSEIAPERLKAVHEVIDERPVLLPKLMELAQWMRTRYRCLLVDGLRQMIPAQMRGDRVHILAVWMARRTVAGEALAAALDAVSARAPKQRALLTRLSEEWTAVSELPEGSMTPLRALEKRGYVELKRREKRRRPYAGLELQPPERFVYTPEQAAAIEEIQSALELRRGSFLLHGVTGSGKTEVYIQAIRTCLSMGRTAIFLVPEISLTPQMVEWFRARFGDRAAVMHSGLSVGERFDEWRRLRDGEADVVIGARSAVFAPLSNLGLILIDEEHEGSYISDRTPRYDAREVAGQRAKMEGAVLVLGSATPSIASFRLAMARTYTLLEMPDRVAQRGLPEVRIVDMRKELIGGNRSVFSGALYAGLKKALAAGDQAILFMNRRGFHTFVSCRECGKSVKCDQCDVTMTYHMPEEILKCHYCEAVKKKPDVCPHCGSRFIRFFGAGTQMIEAEAKRLFPGITVLRADNDTTRTKDAHAKLFAAFRRGDAQVMIGTQMIAKGLDFPNVTLVGVMAADTALSIADYRSEERTFQLITQVAGRAGRGVRPGTVYVQTYQPDHYAIQCAANQDYRSFYHLEMNRRRKSLYPPYTLLVRVLASSPAPEPAKAACEAIEGQMKQFFLDYPEQARQVVQMRAMEAPIGKIRGMARWQVFLKLYAKGPSGMILDRLYDLSAAPVQDVELSLEVNPASML